MASGIKLQFVIQDDSAGSSCALSCTVASNKIATVSIISGGANYTTPPLILVSPSGGDTITVPALILPVLTAGVVTSVILAEPGDGYAHAPVLSAYTATSETPYTLDLDSDALTSLEAYRVAQTTTYVGYDEFSNPIILSKPTYPDVLTMLQSIIHSYSVSPALMQYPSSSIAAEQSTISTANTNINTLIVGASTTTTLAKKRFLAAAAAGVVKYSSGGAWTSGTNAVSSNPITTWFGGPAPAFFMPQDDLSFVRVSFDGGSTWSSITNPGDYRVVAGAYDPVTGKTFMLAYPDSGTPLNMAVLVTSDLVTYTTLGASCAFATDKKGAACVALGQLWVGGNATTDGNNSISTSTDGTSWSDFGFNVGVTTVRGLAGTATELVVVSESHLSVFTSTTPSASVNFGFSGTHLATDGAGKYVASEWNIYNDMRWSTNSGSSWSTATTKPWTNTSDITALTFGDGLFHCVVDSAEYTSADGSVWIATGQTVAATSMSYGVF